MFELDSAGTSIGSDLAPALLSSDATTGAGSTVQQYIAPGSLLPSTAYRFIVAVSAPWSRGVLRTSASVDVTTASCPRGGYVTASSLTGVAGVTRSGAVC